MKIKLYLITALFFTVLFADAQRNQVDFFDDFNSNSNSWSVGNKAGYFAQIKNGKYIVECKSKYISYNFWRSYFFRSNQDFQVEAKIKLIKGTGFSGILWGTSSWENSYYFDISKQGKFKIWGYKNKVKNVIKSVTSSSAIKPNGFNTISVKKVSSKWKFYINGTLVYTANSRPLYGKYCGFKVTQNNRIAVDYTKVQHPSGAINLISKSVSKYSKKNMGSMINSPYDEIAPVISPDGNTLYVARQGHPQNSTRTKFDIWYSTRNSSGKWSKLKRMGKPLNNKSDNVVISVSPDNNTLLLEELYNSDGSHKSDQGISITHRTNSGWSVPKKVVIDGYYNLNQYESFCPSTNGKAIIMSVERRDGLGEKDLFISFRKADGTYGKPKNMGNVLNSANEEGTPYIAPDNKTLYFYSYTEPGYGSADIFMSKRLDDTWTKWSTPKNLGKKINTTDWDVYYTVSAKGDYAYLVSSAHSYGGSDIFTIKLRDEEKPDAVVIVQGKVLNQKTGKPIGTKIVYENEKTGEIEGYARSNPKTGDYKIILTFGSKYEIRAKKKNYMPIIENIDLEKKSAYKEIKKDLYMIPIIKSKPIILKDVNFYAAKSKLLPKSYKALNELVKTMKDNPTMIIEVDGHTETRTGYEAKLLALSKRRAKAVKKYLIKKGISADRIFIKAFGGTKPIASNDTERGREKNRRVEFVIIQK